MRSTRRGFLLAAGGSQLLGCDYGSHQALPWEKFSLTVNRPGMSVGHKARDTDYSKLVVAGQRSVDALIIGSGVAGLTAAWNLQRAGYKNFAVLAGPEVYGNAAGLSLNKHACPTGAHYLPLPSIESVATREILTEMGVMSGPLNSDKPSYDERVLVHSPAERVFFQGSWHHGLIPSSVATQKELFLERVSKFAKAVGSDGRRAFAVPVAQASEDKQYRRLDSITFAQWLVTERFADEHLLAYLDYCCRDEYGVGISVVSAWAGLHYFCSRGGQGSNAEEGAVLTWADGLSPVMRYLDKDIRSTERWLVGTALSVRKVGASVQVISMNETDEVTLIKARKVVVATPLYVSARIDAEVASSFKNQQNLMPLYQPWVVANFLFKHHLPEQAGAELAWDNVVHLSKSLGFVNAKHQDFNIAASNARPQLLTAYHAAGDAEPLATRRWLAACSDDELLALATPDLISVYGRDFWRYLSAAHITVRAHGMPSPRPGYMSNKLLRDLGSETGSILYANADLSGYSVFEEAAYWGKRAASQILS
jgi:Flavin containing amine oxidoreductase